MFEITSYRYLLSVICRHVLNTFHACHIPSVNVRNSVYYTAPLAVKMELFIASESALPTRGFSFVEHIARNT